MTRAHRVALVAALTTTVGAAAGCAPSSGARVEVEMSALSFAPETVTAFVGDTLVWVNRDLVPHTVRSGDSFASGPIAGGEAFSFVPAAPAEVRYVCDYHPTMRGVLKVQPR